MELKGKPPVVIKDRFKGLFFGKEKVGKTMCAVSFPAPYVIDAENRLKYKDHVDMVNKNKGAHVIMSDFNDIIEEVKKLMQLKHPYKTLVIDSLTVVQNELVTACTAAYKCKDRRNAYQYAYEKENQLIQLLKRLDMNVIVIAHKKDDYDKKTDEVIGYTYDAYKGFGYLFDVVLEIEKRGEKFFATPTGAVGNIGRVGTFEFNYEKFVEIYGPEIFESECKPQPLATSDQINKINDLIAATNTPIEKIHQWLSLAKASNFSEMEYTKIQACIDHLIKKLNSNT